MTLVSRSVPFSKASFTRRSKPLRSNPESGCVPKRGNIVLLVVPLVCHCSLVLKPFPLSYIEELYVCVLSKFIFTLVHLANVIFIQAICTIFTCAISNM